MSRWRNRPNSILAAPIVTIPDTIARYICAELSGRWDPHWHRLARLVDQQLFPDCARHTLTLGPSDLHDLLTVLLDIIIDFGAVLGAGRLSPEACGFTEADIREVIDLHQHHYGPVWDF